MYSCSSLIDTGVAEYFSDSGWLLLLRGMRQVKREHGGDFLRVFFIDRRAITIKQFEALAKIVVLHLESGVSVGFMEDTMITGDARIRRNMALMDHKVLIDATDQVQWDLGLTKDPFELSSSHEKHSLFVDKSFLIFRPEDKIKAISVMRDNFDIQES